MSAIMLVVASKMVLTTNIIMFVTLASKTATALGEIC